MFDKDLTPEFVNEHHKTARNKLHPIKGELRINQDLTKEKTEVLLGISEYVAVTSVLKWHSIKNAVEEKTLNLETISPYAHLLQRE